MRYDILPGYIGHQSLIAVLLCIKDQRTFPLLRCIAIPLGTKKDTQLERHVEARQWWISIAFGTGNVVNSVSARLNDRLDFGEPVFGTVLGLERTARAEAGADDRKDNGAKNGLERGVESAVDEYVPR